MGRHRCGAISSLRGLHAHWGPREVLPNQPQKRRVSNPAPFPRCMRAAPMQVSSARRLRRRRRPAPPGGPPEGIRAENRSSDIISRKWRPARIVLARLLGLWDSMGLRGGTFGAFLPPSSTRKKYLPPLPLSPGAGGGRYFFPGAWDGGRRRRAAGERVRETYGVGEGERGVDRSYIEIRTLCDSHCLLEFVRYLIQ